MAYAFRTDLSRRCEDSPTVVDTEQVRLSKFFIDYHSHSEQLVDALYEWSELLRFTSCKYEEGLLDTQDAIGMPPSDRGFMRYMKKHLKKEEQYKPILTLASEIEHDHTETCKKIHDIMVSDDPISVTPSFQKIITDKIQFACQALKRSRDVNLATNNIYIDFFIFQVIFEKVSRKKSSIKLEVKNERDTWVLIHQNSVTLGQGNKSDMNKLKEVIEELILDNHIRGRVEGYNELRKRLLNDERINELKDKIASLATFIHGGGYLGGLDACELCDPTRSAPRRT